MASTRGGGAAPAAFRLRRRSGPPCGSESGTCGTRMQSFDLAGSASPRQIGSSAEIGSRSPISSASLPQ
eukprot:11899226-Alexandrium_andersonii.AAC.1